MRTRSWASHVLPLLYVGALCLHTAGATTLRPVERTCPIGGEKFQSMSVMSTSQFGLRLDLRPRGPAAHLPWTECPNGFVVYKDAKAFTQEEIGKLTPVVASSEYQRTRETDTTAYRVVYLRRSLGEGDADLRWVLLRAAWEAEGGAKEDKRQEYLKQAADAFAARVEAHAEHDKEWWANSIVRAEIERQRHRFKESISLLNALPISELPSDDTNRSAMEQIREHAERKDADPADFKRDEPSSVIPPGE